ncbi:MAG: UDP-glucuronic acid decarboxylase family protein [Hyphomicrobiales bacterium]
MHILVTGGAGFLGSHLCNRLIADSHQVHCVDNLRTGWAANIAHLKGNPGFRFTMHDVVTPFEGRFERIYNLACPASPPHYQHDPIATARTSFMGTDNLLDLARRTGARLFQASTSEVYGDPGVHPQTENYRGNVNPVGPRACYDEGKRVAETLCFDYRRMHGTEIKVARIFNTYGPRMNPRDGRVVSNFVVQALRGEPLTIYGEGLQTRSFCYVDDLIDGFVKLMESPAGVTGPINLGNPEEFTIRQLAELVIAKTGSKSTIAHRELPPDDPRQRRPDISMAKTLLGWEPRIALRDGLARTIAYFRDRLAEMAA